MAVFGLRARTRGYPMKRVKIQVIKQFQASLFLRNYDTAASLFEANPGEEDFLSETGLDLTDLPGSFERLCENQEFFCYPVYDLVMMGNDWDTMVYLVRLEDSTRCLYFTQGCTDNLFLPVS